MTCKGKIILCIKNHTKSKKKCTKYHFQNTFLPSRVCNEKKTTLSIVYLQYAK